MLRCWVSDLCYSDSPANKEKGTKGTLQGLVRTSDQPPGWEQRFQVWLNIEHNLTGTNFASVSPSFPKFLEFFTLIWPGTAWKKASFTLPVVLRHPQDSRWLADLVSVNLAGWPLTSHVSQWRQHDVALLCMALRESTKHQLQLAGFLIWPGHTGQPSSSVQAMNFHRLLHESTKYCYPKHPDIEHVLEHSWIGKLDLPSRGRENRRHQDMKILQKLQVKDRLLLEATYR